MKINAGFVPLIIIVALAGCNEVTETDFLAIAATAPGWRGEIIGTVDQSYAGWDIEIGDADNDGANEVLTTGCPGSRLYLFKKNISGWTSAMLAENLAERFPGMGLAVKVVDLNNDGANEVILGTGQEGEGTAFFYVLETDGETITKKIFSRPEFNKSAFTHDLASYDLDGDGLLEVISAYCGNGEIIRYDVDKDMTKIEARKLHQLSGSGEESLISDVDNDGEVEYITSNAFRERDAKIEIFEFDDAGELVTPARLIIDNFDGNRCFYVSLMVGDVDNDGKNELIAGWKQDQKINKSTLIAYRIGETVETAYTFAREDEDLDMGYFEKMMAIADADNDGMNELLISTRGDNMSEFISSKHFGHVFMFKVRNTGMITKELLVNFHDEYAESSWLEAGDADNDGKNEIILATGKGDRTKPGTSYVVLLEME